MLPAGFWLNDEDICFGINLACHLYDSGSISVCSLPPWSGPQYLDYFEDQSTYLANANPVANDERHTLILDPYSAVAFVRLFTKDTSLPDEKGIDGQMQKHVVNLYAMATEPPRRSVGDDSQRRRASLASVHPLRKR